MSRTRTIGYGQLVQRCARILTAAGVPPSRAERVAELYVRADAEGAASHGVARLSTLVRRIDSGVVDPTASPSTIHDRGAVAVLDGHHGLGQIVADAAMGLALDKARQYGVGMVAVRDASHLGRVGHYAHDAARSGAIGVVLSNASPRLVPAPGAQPVLGNNPWAVAWPAPDGPICVDMANSVVAAGKIRAARTAGEPIPSDWATDAHGAPTSDPAAALDGALLAMGGHKGWALSLVVDVMSGGLAEGAMGDAVGAVDEHERHQRVSASFAAIDVGHFTDPERFVERMGDFAARLKARTGLEARLPGERSSRLLREQKRAGVEVDKTTLAAIDRLASGIASRDQHGEEA